PALGFVGPSWAQQAQGTVIDLQFKERKEDPNSWYGFTADKDGKIQRSFATASGKLTFQLVGDTLRADTTGDGAIDDKDAPACEATDARQTIRIKVPVQFGEKTVDYPLCIRIQKAGSQRYLLVSSAAMLEGTFGQYTIRIFDGALNGRFEAPSAEVEVQSSASQAPPGMNSVPWSQTIAFDRKLQEVALVDKGTRLKLTPYTGPTAEVQLEFSTSVQSPQALLQETGNAQIGRCSSGEMGLFVPGKYRIYSLNYQIGNTEQRAYLYGSHTATASPLELKPGKNIVKVGPPFKMDFTATRNGEVVEFTQVMITGQAGESYRPSIQENQGDSFAAYIRVGEKEQKLTTLGFS
ncbi:MAG TPA: hypothetical protein VHP11_17140, partial [Tepidisphaeraceae bacterium]|nr:hypothetical protein [Tepidisphaeraceae bacterium]